jgi:large subunit ribosomal protein L1
MTVTLGSLKEALSKALDSPKQRFTQSVDLVVNLRDVDPKKPENRFNELVELPNSPGKTPKICVIAGGQLAVEAKKSGADAILTREDLDSLAKNRKAARKLAKEYDFFVAEAPMMPLVGRTLGPLLGPRGKMPTPIPPNAPLTPIIERLRRTVRIRLKDQPTIQCRIGAENMDADKLAENAQAVLRRLEEKLEKGVRNISKVFVKKTMGEAVEVEAKQR